MKYDQNDVVSVPYFVDEVIEEEIEGLIESSSDQYYNFTGYTANKTEVCLQFVASQITFSHGEETFTVCRVNSSHDCNFTGTFEADMKCDEKTIVYVRTVSFVC